MIALVTTQAQYPLTLNACVRSAFGATAARMAAHHIQGDLQGAQLEGGLAGAEAQLLAVDAAGAVQVL
jgi:hypothetical protein